MNRRNLKAALLVMFATFGATSAGVIDEMSPDSIDAAIAFGQAPGNHPQKTLCYEIKGESRGTWLWGLFGPRYSVEGCLYTPFLKVAFASGVAQYKKEKFSAKSVTKEMIKPEVTLIVRVTGPVGLPGLKNVILASGDYTVSPSMLLPPDRETKKQDGAVVEVLRAAAVFGTRDMVIAEEAVVVLEDGTTLKIDLGSESMKDVR